MQHKNFTLYREYFSKQFQRDCRTVVDGWWFFPSKVFRNYE